MKRAAARAALAYVAPDSVIGVGTGSTTEHFIEELGSSEIPLEGAIASSEATAHGLAARGIRVLTLDEEPCPEVYIDGADEVDPGLRLIKGAGGALTREKVVASASRAFVCICDESKLVEGLGAAPVPVEVVPMAVAFVRSMIEGLGGEPTLREGVRTDNGNRILDVAGLELGDPLAVELALDAIPGVVENGVFAMRPADLVLVGTADGVREVAAADASGVEG
jgi:ribose 5-phosphate isomerase A